MRHPQFERDHLLLDVMPKQWCCNGSDVCDLYYELHPVGSCYETSSYRLGNIILIHIHFYVTLK